MNTIFMLYEKRHICVKILKINGLPHPDIL